MMREVMISIQPKWCELIASGKKTVEVRKTRPKLETPFKVYIYCTQARKPIREEGRILLYEDDLAITNRWGRGKKIENPHGCLKEGELLLNGKVIGEFVCDRIDYVRNYGDMVDSYDCVASCLSANEIIEYAKDKNGNFVYTYAWHISNLVIYDKPKELGDFKVRVTNEVWSFTKKLESPPQSWCYVEKGGVQE